MRIGSWFVMLAGTVCGCIVLCIIEFLSRSVAWVAWGYTTAIGIGTLIFVLAKRRRRRKWVQQEMGLRG